MEAVIILALTVFSALFCWLAHRVLDRPHQHGITIEPAVHFHHHAHHQHLYQVLVVTNPEPLYRLRESLTRR